MPGTRAAGVGAVAAGRLGGEVVLGGGEDLLGITLLGMEDPPGTEHRLRMRRVRAVWK